MRNQFILFTTTLLLAFSYTGARGEEGNLRLAALMRAVSADNKVIVAPTKAPVVSEVTEAAVWDAVMRTRTLRFSLQAFKLKIGRVQDGKFVANEFSPVSISALEGAALVAALSKAIDYIDQLMERLRAIEASYSGELTKPAGDRDFKVVRAILGEVTELMKGAHKLFQ